MALIVDGELYDVLLAVYQGQGATTIESGGVVYRVVSDGDRVGFLPLPNKVERSSFGIRDPHHRGWYQPVNVTDRSDFDVP